MTALAIAVAIIALLTACYWRWPGPTVAVALSVCALVGARGAMVGDWWAVGAAMYGVIGVFAGRYVLQETTR